MNKPRKEIEVCSYFSTVRSKVIKIKGTRKTPFEFVYAEKCYARFDSEDKARLYQEAFQEGVNVGYDLHKKEMKTDIFPVKLDENYKEYSHD